MAAKIICFFMFIAGTNAEGQFTVLHVPHSLQFPVDTTQFKDAILKDVFSVALGLTPKQKSTPDMMKLLNPFNTPESVVVVRVEGVTAIGPFDKDARSFPLTTSLREPDTYEFIAHRISKFNETKCKLVNMKLSTNIDMQIYSYIFGLHEEYELPKLLLVSLNNTSKEDYEFLRELQTLRLVTTAVKSGFVKPDGLVDFYSFRFSSLQTLSNYHSPDSSMVEAKHLLNQQIRELSKAFVKAYNGSILVSVITTDDSNTGNTYRRQRRMVTETTDENTDIAMINIIFWICNTLFFAMLSIVYVMVTMDPGRDSIVYRMTSSIDRIKME